MINVLLCNLYKRLFINFLSCLALFYFKLNFFTSIPSTKLQSSITFMKSNMFYSYTKLYYFCILLYNTIKLTNNNKISLTAKNINFVTLLNKEKIFYSAQSILLFPYTYIFRQKNEIWWRKHNDSNNCVYSLQLRFPSGIFGLYCVKAAFFCLHILG